MIAVDYDPTELVPACPVCDGEGYLLGALSTTFHFRCRCCGVDYTLKPKTPTKEK